MSSGIASRERSSPGARRWALWTGLIGGGLAWTLHLFSAYAIAEFGCVAGLGHSRYGGISHVAWMVIAATAVSIALSATATFVAFRSERRVRVQSHDETAAVAQSLAHAGLLASGIFTFVILFETIPILFYLRDC